MGIAGEEPEEGEPGGDAGGLLVPGLMTAGMTVGACLLRPPSAVLRGSLLVGVPLGVLSFALAAWGVYGVRKGLAAWSSGDGLIHRRPRSAPAIAGGLALVLGAAFYSGWVILSWAFARSLAHFYQARQDGSFTKSLLGTGAMWGVLLVSFLLFVFRVRRRSTYGLTETLVGLSVAIKIVSGPGVQTKFDENLVLGLLTASVYLVIRGLDNIHTGLTKEPKDPWALRFVRLLDEFVPGLTSRIRRLLTPTASGS